MDALLAGGEHDGTFLPRRAALSQALAALLPVPLLPGRRGRGFSATQLTARPGPEILRDGTGMRPAGPGAPTEG